MGQLTSTTYPTGGGFGPETINYGYDLTGRITSAASSSYTYLQNATYDGIGELTDRVFGSTTATVPLPVYDRHIGMDPTDQTVQEVSTSTGTDHTVGKIQDDFYNWDAGGNLTSVQDTMTATAQIQCYHYDPLNRLTHAYTAQSACGTANHAITSIDAPAYDLSYTYTGASSISTVVDAMKSTGNSTNYVYGTPSRPGQVTSVTGNSNRGPWSAGIRVTGTYGYDAAGQMTSSQPPAGTPNLVYNSRHELTSMTTSAGTSKFDYDAVREPDREDRPERHYHAVRRWRRDHPDQHPRRGRGIPEPLLHRRRHHHRRTHRCFQPQQHHVLGAQRPARFHLVSDRHHQNRPCCGYPAAVPALRRAAHTLQRPHRPRIRSSASRWTRTGLLADGARYYNPALGVFTSPDPLAASAPSPSAARLPTQPPTPPPTVTPPGYASTAMATNKQPQTASPTPAHQRWTPAMSNATRGQSACRPRIPLVGGGVGIRMM